jgi:hypothetical protein
LARFSPVATPIGLIAAAIAVLPDVVEAGRFFHPKVEVRQLAHTRIALRRHTSDLASIIRQQDDPISSRPAQPPRVVFRGSPAL